MTTALRLTTTLALLLAAGCGGDDDPATAPESRAPRAGRYAFTWSNGFTTGIQQRTYAGTLVIVSAIPKVVVATWNVPGFAVLAGDGQWNVDAYRIVGNADAGQVILRVRKGTGDNLSCEGKLTRLSGGQLLSVDGTCTLTFTGP
jgi:hypothetical protein